MAYTFYESIFQETEPEVIPLETFKFILRELDRQNKKIGYDKLENGMVIISWLNYKSKFPSAVVIDGKDTELYKGVRI